MKKSLLVLASMVLVAFNAAFPQQVNRNFVVMEMITGTW